MQFGRWVRGHRQRAALLVLAAVAVVAAAIAIPLAGSSGPGASRQTKVTVTTTGCAPEWKAAVTGHQTFTVTNRAAQATEVLLQDANAAIGQRAIIAEIETLGPKTSATMTTTLSTGRYVFSCAVGGRPATKSRVVHPRGPAFAVPPLVVPVVPGNLEVAGAAYLQYDVAPQLATLATQVAALRGDLVRADVPAAERDWLAAQLTWEEVGAAYDAFGDLGAAIDGLPQGLPGGVTDPQFTGLHRLEYGLWHNQSAAQLRPVAGRLVTAVATLRRKLPTLAIDATVLPIRAHEILEDAVRDHLSGMSDEGAGAGYAETSADVSATRVVVDKLAPLLSPYLGLLPKLKSGLDAAAAALTGIQTQGHWQAVAATPIGQRQRVDSAIGALVETLSTVPTLLEIPPTH